MPWGYVWPGDKLGLPPGLTMNRNNCTIEGTPTGSTGSYSITTQVTNVSNVYRSFAVMRIVVEEPIPPIHLDPDPLAFMIPKTYGQDLEWGQSGRYYEFQPVVTGGKPFMDTGTPRYSWSVDSLPSGLSMNPDTGLINGVPALAGTYNFNITAKDMEGAYISTNVNLDINFVSRPYFLYVPWNMYLPEGTELEDYTGYTFTGAAGLENVYTFQQWGLPTGLTLDPNTGLVSGTPAQGTHGTHLVRIWVEDQYTLDHGLSEFYRYVYITINKAAAKVYSESFNTDICTGDYFDNCTMGTPPPKHGLLQDYWTFASFGFMNFTKIGADPEVNQCMPPSNDENFFTAVQNAQPVSGLGKMINAENMAVQYFIDAAGVKSSCPDVFPEDVSSCQKNYILMLTSGESADEPATPEVFDDSTNADKCLSVPDECKTLTYSLSKNACYGYEQDLRPNCATAADMERPGDQTVNTYVVHTMGQNADILKETATSSDGQYYFASNAREIKEKLETALQDMIKKAAAGTAASVLASGEGSGANIIQAIYYPKRRFLDTQSGLYDEISWIGKLSAFWFYSDPYLRYSDIREEADPMNSPPSLSLSQDHVITPFFNSISRFVEADEWKDVDGNGVIDLLHPEVGTSNDLHLDHKDFEEVPALWEAGKMLWKRDLNTDPRTIYMNLDGSSNMQIFSNSLAGDSTLQGYMQTVGVANTTDVINFVHGYEVPGKRPRMVKVDIDGDGQTELEPRVWKLGDILDSSPVIASKGVPTNLYNEDYCDDSYEKFFTLSDSYNERGMVYAGGNDGMLHAFKLGYLEQTPGEDPLATLYNSPGGQNLYGSGIDQLGYEKWAFIPRNALPYLKYTMENNYCHVYMVDQTVTMVDASICESTLNADGTGTKNTQDAAQCGGDPSFPRREDSWRSILVGGMRYGGGCKPATASCTVDTNGDGAVNDDDCIKVPVQTASGENVGYSSYFALDITNEDTPVFLWEFSHPELGHTTTGPTFVRFKVPEGDWNTLGQWYALFGSGPTGPIDKLHRQYLGASDQSVKIFVLDLKTGEFPSTLPGGYVEPVDPINNGFIHTMGKVSRDFTNFEDVGGAGCESWADYDSDAVYMGYTSKCESGDVMANGATCPVGTWRNGGIVRILTGQKADPDLWKVSTMIEDIGPVFSAPEILRDTHDNVVWVFVGTGRYFYERVEPWITGTSSPDAAHGQYYTKSISDDLETQREILAFIDPCSLAGSAQDAYGSPAEALDCTAKALYSDLLDVTDDPANTTAGPWRISLDLPDPAEPRYDQYNNKMLNPDGTEVTDSVGAERVLTNIKATLTNQMLTVTTFKPYTDQCMLGGKTYLWALNMATGGALSAASLRGIAILQVSTGNIKKVDLSEDFILEGGRKTTGEDGLTTVTAPVMSEPPRGTPKILHILERH
jgi:type IV pilus assembly protein PilY1